VHLGLGQKRLNQRFFEFARAQKSFVHIANLAKSTYSARRFGLSAPEPAITSRFIRINEGSTPGLERACNSEKVCDSKEFVPLAVSSGPALPIMDVGSIPTAPTNFLHSEYFIGAFDTSKAFDTNCIILRRYSSIRAERFSTASRC
jgi:hypothetical protein